MKRSIPSRSMLLCLGVAILSFAFSTSSAVGANPPLTVGQETFTTGMTNVRATADGTLVGTQPRYSVGTVTAGPSTVTGNSVLWYKVTFLSGPSGWVGADMLIDGIPLPKTVQIGPGQSQNMVLDELGDIEMAYTSGVDSNNNPIFSFSESTNQGLTFTPPIVVPMASFFQPPVYPPQIAAERNGAIDIVYTCGPAQCSFGVGNPSVVLIRSVDHGTTWSAPMQVSVPPHPSRSGAGEPVIAACGAGVTIAWTDDGIGSNGRPDIASNLFIVNVVNGAPGTPINVTYDAWTDIAPQLLVNPQGTVYLSWTVRTDNGAAPPSNTVNFTSLPNCAAVAQ